MLRNHLTRLAQNTANNSALQGKLPISTSLSKSRGGDDNDRQSAHSAASSSAHWTDRKQGHEKHWMDRAWPGTREWLEGQNRRWWLRSIMALCSQYPALTGREQEIAALTEQSYRAFMDKHAGKAVDERGQTHLQVVCLMLATKKVLQPFIRDSQEVLRLIRAQAGERTSPLLRFLLRCVLAFTADPYASSVRRLKALRLDMGRAFDTSVADDGRAALLEVRSCLYQAVLREEDAQALLAGCCCSQDSVWFDSLERHCVRFQRSSWLGSGDACCALQLQRAAKT